MKKYNEFGLSEESTKWILRVIQIFPEIDEVIIFGSRAKGTSKPGSDIDFAIKGEFPDFTYPEKLRNLLQDGLYLPYFFDVVDYSKITNPDLKDHIDRVGKTFYLKKEAVQ
jgi:predicted nucleotidyltransferase